MSVSFQRIVAQFDDFGYPMQLTYKGSETHQSFFGGLITIVVLAFTSAMIFLKIEEVVTMSEPAITSFTR